MCILVIVLLLMIVELSIMAYILRMNKINLLKNYKYLMAEYMVNAICTKVDLPPEQALEEIKKILKTEERIENGRKRKLLNNRRIKRNI